MTRNYEDRHVLQHRCKLLRNELGKDMDSMSKVELKKEFNLHSCTKVLADMEQELSDRLETLNVDGIEDHITKHAKTTMYKCMQGSCVEDSYGNLTIEQCRDQCNSPIDVADILSVVSDFLGVPDMHSLSLTSMEAQQGVSRNLEKAKLRRFQTTVATLLELKQIYREKRHFQFCLGKDDIVIEILAKSPHNRDGEYRYIIHDGNTHPDKSYLKHTQWIHKPIVELWTHVFTFLLQGYHVDYNCRSYKRIL